MKKKTSIILVCFIVLLGVLFAVGNFLPQQYSKWFLLYAVILVIIWLVVKMVRMVRLSKVVSGPTNLLYEEKDPVAYVEAMEKILEDVTQKEQKDLIRINISTGLLYAGQYSDAIAMLDNISVNRQPVVNQVLCFANRALSLFLSDQFEQGQAVVNEHKAEFSKYENAQGISNNVITVYAAEKTAQGKYEEAWKQLERLKGVKLSQALEDVVLYYRMLVAKKLEKEEDFVRCKEKLRREKRIPAIKEKLQNLL